MSAEAYQKIVTAIWSCETYEQLTTCQSWIENLDLDESMKSDLDHVVERHYFELSCQHEPIRINKILYPTE